MILERYFGSVGLKAHLVLLGNINPPGGKGGWSPAQGAEMRRSVLMRVGSLLPRNVATLLAPSARDCTRNLLCATDQYNTEPVTITLPSSIRRPMREKEIRVVMDLSADAVLLHDQTEAYFIAPADCPVGILLAEVSGGKRVIFGFHAGRDCLLSLDENTGEVSKGGRGSIVDTVIREARKHGATTGELCFVQGICAQHFLHYFDHPTYGRRNEAFARLLADAYSPFPGTLTAASFALDLIGLAQQQFAQQGFVIRGDVPAFGPCSYSDRRLYSLRRSSEMGKPSDPGRNAVLISLA